MSKLLDYIFAEDIRREIADAQSRVMTYASEEVFRKHFPKGLEFNGLIQSSFLPNLMNVFGIGSLAYSIDREDPIAITMSLLITASSELFRRVSRKSIIHKLEEAESDICYKHYNLDQDYDTI